MVELYKMALSERDHDSQRFWTIFGVMNVINAGMFAIITGREASPTLRTLTALAGIGICVVWYLAERRMGAWIAWWEAKLVELEAACFAELRQAGAATTLRADFSLFVGRAGAVTVGVSTRTAGSLLPILFLAAWLLLLMSPLLGIFGWLEYDCGLSL